jgi:HEPN domain-containing protein
MAVLKVVGFEKQTLTADIEIVSVVGSPTIDTSIKRSGAASLKCATTGSEASVRIDDSPASAIDAVRQVAFYIPTGGLPASLTKIVQLQDAGGDHTSVRINSDGTLELWDDSGAIQLGSDTPAISLNAWNIIELDVGTTHGGNDAKLKLNGVMVAEGATISAGATHRFMEVGVMGSVTATVYFDDIVVSDHNGGADFAGWINGIKLVMALPNAAGDSAATAGNFASIDDNDDADYIELDDNTTIAEYNCQDSSAIGLPSNALVQFVAVGYRVRGETASTCTYVPRIKSQASGTTATGTTTTIASASFNTHDDTATAKVYKLVSYTDPQAGGSWTPAKVDSMQIGSGTTDAAPDVWISQIWAYIGYFEKTDAMIFRDEFAVSTNTALESKTPNIGTSWTRLHSSAGTGALAMAATDRASPQGDLNDGVMYTANTTYPSADYEIEFEMNILDTATTNPQFALIRVQDQENMYAVRLNDQGGTNTCQLYKKVTGTWSPLGSAFSPPYDGAVCKLQIIGNNLKFFIDGVEVASATPTDITATGEAGLAWGGGTELINSGDDMDVDNDTDNFTVYNLGSAVSQELIQKSLKYTIRKAVSITKSLKYTIKTTPSATTKSLTYRIRKAIGITKGLTYVILSEQAVTKSLKYTILTTASITKGLIYRISTEVPITKSLQYTIRSAQAVTKSLKYTILKTFSITKSLQYEVVATTEVVIQKSLKYAILNKILITKNLQYVVFSAQSVTKSLKYTIFKSFSVTKSLTYQVTSGQAINKSLKYTILVKVSVQKSLKYTIFTTTSITKGLEYFIAITTAINKGLTYRIKSKQSVQKSLKYTIFNIFAITKSLQYVIKLVNTLTKSLTYRVTAEQSITKSLHYTIISTPAAVTKSLKYTIISTPSAVTKNLTYRISTEIGITKELIYKIKSKQSVQKSLKYTIIKSNSITKGLNYAIARTFYTREAKASLPTNETPLATIYSPQDYLDVELNDAIRVNIEADIIEFGIHNFRYRSTDNTQDITVHWNGQSELAPSSSEVFLQIYNYNLNQWETLDSNNTENANTDFDLNGVQSIDVADYYDPEFHVTVRVYQEGI